MVQQAKVFSSCCISLSELSSVPGTHSGRRKLSSPKFSSTRLLPTHKYTDIAYNNKNLEMIIHIYKFDYITSMFS